MKFHPRLTVIAALVASGCAVMSPEAEQQLAGARAAYSQAAADAHVQRYAQPELGNAAQALQDAERMAKEGEDPVLVEHNAYLAERRARTALSTAQARQGEAAILEARAERRRLEAEARAREAAAARAEAQRAESARREAEARARQLEEEKLKVVQEKTAAAELGAEVKRLEAEYPGVQAKQTPRGWVLALSNELLFESGTGLKDGADRALDDLAQFLSKHPERNIAIEGFTDSMGPKDAAERLSERRAQAVKFALVQRGVEPHRIDARGYGPSFPVASNDTELGRLQNRRVEIIINPS
jgi:outer membrane protein OmpA-like peptidoglycan-associated protein